MDLGSLKHLLELVRVVHRTGDIIVFGSSSMLATYPEEGEEDGVLLATYDADFIPEPFDERAAHTLQEMIGKQQAFHDQFGYFADIVRPLAFENFPPGWRERTVSLAGFTGVHCLEPHDMAAAKCIAGRPKDIEQLGGLAAKGKLNLDLVHDRLWSMELIEKMIVKSHDALKKTRIRAVELRREWNIPEP